MMAVEEGLPRSERKLVPRPDTGRHIVRAQDRMSRQQLLLIGEVAKRSGFATSAVRFYERAGWLPRPERRPGGRLWRRKLTVARFGAAIGRLSSIEAEKLPI